MNVNGGFMPSKQMIKILVVACSIMFLCSKSNTEITSKDKAKVVKEIDGVQAIQNLIDTSGNTLLMFDLYADWCMPCKVLSPLLETIADENKKSVKVYKINIDKNRDIAAAFQVTGIPLVVYIKNKTVVQAFTGVQPKDTYVRAINQHATPIENVKADKPDGELVNGTRVIRLTTVTSPGNLYVYRGEEVKLIIEKVDIPYSIHIPSLNISKTATIGKDLEIDFKAHEIGVFPFFCNGKCPTGDGQRFAQLVVMEYATTETKSIFKTINSQTAKELIDQKKPFILDVRTPHEFYEGFIKDAYLLPVQQLADRISEIEKYKNSPVLVYCRSGNRSIVASQILIKNGFKEVYNLRGGVKDWKDPLVKAE